MCGIRRLVQYFGLASSKLLLKYRAHEACSALAVLQSAHMSLAGPQGPRSVMPDQGDCYLKHMVRFRICKHMVRSAVVLGSDRAVVVTTGRPYAAPKERRLLLLRSSPSSALSGLLPRRAAAWAQDCDQRRSSPRDDLERARRSRRVVGRRAAVGGGRHRAPVRGAAPAGHPRAHFAARGQAAGV